MEQVTDAPDDLGGLAGGEQLLREGVGLAPRGLADVL